MDSWIKNKIKVPKLGFGTFMLKKEETVQAVKYALVTGFRHIDTAQIYFNEEEVGQAIKESSLKREEIFLTTKIYKDSLTPEKIRKTFSDSLNKLRTEYVDLLLIHWPNPKISLKETFTTFEELKKEKKISNIGVSNFPLDLLMEAKKLCPSLITNQVEYHPLLSQKKLLKVMGQDIFLTAYSSLMRGKIFKIQQIVNLAKKYNKSPAQISLRWLIEQKNVVALFMSKNKKHIEENFNIFDFQLESQDRELIFRLNKNKQRLIDPPFAPHWDA